MRRRALILVAAIYVVGTIVARRRGYPMGGDVLVRCREGHVFTTIWIPGVSLKSIRLGWWRFQRCPVGRHWSLVSPVRASDLTDEDRHAAAQQHDLRIP
jgi:hypothetical protein